MRNLLLFLLVVLFAGCSPMQRSVAPHEKAFAEEDIFILQALEAEQSGSFHRAAQLYDILYAGSGKAEYRLRMMLMLQHAKDFKALYARTSAILLDEPENVQAMRFQVAALVYLDRLEDAKATALDLVRVTKAAEDYLRVSEIYIKQKRFTMALKYLEGAYALNFEEKILDKMAILLYVNLERKKEAIAHLETHTRLHGCSEQLCNRLAGFYSEQNNIEGMLSVYLRLYESFGTHHVAEAITKIYMYQKEYAKAMQFLESSQSDDALLLQLYINAKRYADAHRLSQSLYEKSGKAEYLGQSAIFAYESAADKQDAALLEQVMVQLKQVIAELDEPLYLNYLGYLMIDHGLGAEEGMEYVRRALGFEPDSAFYLDSLAWGYYKTGRCEEALKILQRVTGELGNKDPEVLMHIDAVNQCLKGKNR